MRAVSTQESQVLRQPPSGTSNLISLKMKPGRVMNGISHRLPQGPEFNHTRILFGPALLSEKGLISYVPVGALVAIKPCTTVTEQ